MPKIVNSSEKIDFICEKAYEEFIKNGVNSFSLNKFIESLNISKGQFYHYFKTKEELVFEVIDRKSEKFFVNTEKEIKEAQTFLEKLLALFSFYLVLSAPENKPFDKFMKDTFYMYLNIENEFIKQKNAECYDYLFNATNEIFDEMIAKKTLNENAKKFIPSLIATADGMYLQSMILENYDLKKNLIDYIRMLEDLLKR